MKVHLMYPDRDPEVEVRVQARLGGELRALVEGGARPANADDLIHDLGLDDLFAVMTAGDSVRGAMVHHALLDPLVDPAVIRYRQDVLRDCIEQVEAVRTLDDTVRRALYEARGSLLWRGTRPDSLLQRSVSAMELFVGVLRELRQIAETHGAQFRSRGFTRFFAMLSAELDDAYFDEVRVQLERLRFRHGVLISAALTEGDKGTHHVLRRATAPEGGGLLARFGRRRSRHAFEIHPRDEAGHDALNELRGRGVALAAAAVARSVDHIDAFLRILVAELAFYRSCVELHDALAAMGEPLCYPELSDVGGVDLTAIGLYDGATSLRQRERQVANDLRAAGASLVMITGANQGGKSTFLRAIGLAQLMAQAGMFVCAERCRLDLRTAVFTHARREEDPTMQHGKFEEELARMSRLADLISPGSLVLFNESFAATNEREGSAIARQVIDALLACGVKVVFVTHQYDLAHGLWEERRAGTVFLRARRGQDGVRPFRLLEGEPCPTSYGEDLYRRLLQDGLGVSPVS